MEFKEILKSLRKRYGYSLEYVGDYVGTTKVAIWNYETGVRYPKKDKLEAIADLFNVDLDYLTGRSDIPRKVSFDDERMLHEFHKLNFIGKDHAVSEVEKMTHLPKYTISDQNILKEDVVYDESPEEAEYMFFGYIAAAGTWVYPEDIPFQTITTVKMEGANFIIGICGDSMEPTFFDGDKVYVKKTSELEFGEIGLFLVNGYYYVKELGPDGLRSHNPKYATIPKDQEITILGKVIGRVKK